MNRTSSTSHIPFLKKPIPHTSKPMSKPCHARIINNTPSPTSRLKSPTLIIMNMNTSYTNHQTKHESSFDMEKLSLEISKIKERLENNKKKPTDESIESLLTQQRVDIESEFEKISELKKTRGKTAAIFKTFDKIKGKSKDGPELVAMKDPKTDDFIFSPDKLKEVSLKYCANLLDNQKVDKDFADEIECEKLVHYSRMKEDTDDVEELSRDEFEKRLKLLGTKSKEKYKFLLKSGEGFKNCIFRLFSQVWNQETKPQQWRNTVIIQLYKGKGEICNFDSQRNIHTKEDIPKLFEGLVVDKSKHQLVRSCSKFQIGGIPNHRSQEHLFTVKSVLSLYSQLNLPVILQLYDLSKYFDKEILKDAMDTLYSYGVRGKLYRLWYELYKDAQIKVKTGAGMTATEPTGENVAQGSIGGAILSSCNLDKTVSNYFAGSTTELSYTTTRLQPIMFQDDTIRLTTSIEAAQKGNTIMNSAMKRK